MTPKPETQGETYAAMLERISALMQEDDVAGWLEATTDIETLILWQHARIEELRKVTRDRLGRVSLPAEAALKASSPDAAIIRSSHEPVLYK